MAIRKLKSLHKKGNALELVIPPIFQILLPILLVMLPLLAYTNSLSDNKTFEKEFLANDIALTITSLASLNADAELSYLPEPGFTAIIQENNVRVVRGRDPLASTAAFSAPSHIHVLPAEVSLNEPVFFIKHGDSIELTKERKALSGLACSFDPAYEPEGKSILIDPGHGGSDQGFSANGIIESEAVTALAQLIPGEKTRETNRDLSLEERLQKAEHADTTLSLHLGQASPSSSPIKVFFSTASSPQTKDLACRLASRLEDALPNTGAAILPVIPQDLDPNDPKKILLDGKTAVLIELGNVNNADFVSEFNQQKGEIANAMVSGLS
ncbi:MAG TPA: N-acetylmuramoyl-L-alanine amidase [Candidatus Nanoarchaeia archaeon]|nr:N-acetylmuramoyl-L-alanine amidase [Candidatus Nanoarchaeia archaeon]